MIQLAPREGGTNGVAHVQPLPLQASCSCIAEETTGTNELHSKIKDTSYAPSMLGHSRPRTRQARMARANVIRYKRTRPLLTACASSVHSHSRCHMHQTQRHTRQVCTATSYVSRRHTLTSYTTHGVSICLGWYVATYQPRG